MKPSQAAKSAAKYALDPFETLGSQVVKPMGQDVLEQLGGFWNTAGLGARPKTIAQEDLQRAREKEKLEKDNASDHDKSEESANEITLNLQKISGEYSTFRTKTGKEEQSVQAEVSELKAEITKLAKGAGVETKAHLEGTAQTSGKLEIKLLTTIVKFLKIKAEEAKSGNELLSQRKNAKRSTGMLAWVSGKQMKIHEQGTLQLQG